MPSDLISISFHHKCVYHHFYGIPLDALQYSSGTDLRQNPSLGLLRRYLDHFKYSGNIFVEVDPVFPVQEEYTDTDQIGHVFVIIAPVQIFEFSGSSFLFRMIFSKRCPGFWYGSGRNEFLPAQYHRDNR